MNLLSGLPAVAATQQLAQGGLVAVAINPQARLGHPLELIALGTPQRCVVIDVRGTPQLGRWLQQAGPVAAYGAKEVHRALLRSFGQGPSRWGCAKLCELLLAAGRSVPLDLADIAQRYGQPEPAAMDAGIAAMGAHASDLARLVIAQSQALVAAGMQGISKLEAAAVAPVAEMEHRGMPFDARAWQRLAQRTMGERQALRQQILLNLRGTGAGRDLFGQAAVNLDSDASLLSTLRACGFKVADVKRRTLAQLPEPLGPWLSHFRTLTKLTSAYGADYLTHVGADGRLHPTFEQIGASTGRMACHAPNLQAMVKGTEHRSCFRAHPTRRLVIADYSACELRILAEMSGDPVFLDAFARNADLHSQVATSVFGKPVSKERNAHLRQVAKAVNFGLAYGMGAAGLARTINVSPDNARHLLNRYFQTYPRIRGFLEEAAREALQRGYSQTLAGRRLDLRAEPFASNRPMAERVAKNMPIQGTNADIIKIALARLRHSLAAFPETYVVNCVHDEIVVECPADAALAVEETVVAEMVQAGSQLLQQVTLAVDVEITTAWDKDTHVHKAAPLPEHPR